MRACERIAHSPIILAACALTTLGTAAPVTAGTKIEIAYDVDYTEAQPFQKVVKYHQTRTYEFVGGHDVHFSSSDIGHAHNSLGQIGIGKSEAEEEYKWTYRIVKGVFFMVADFPGFVVVRKIRTNGRDACTCENTFRKKPGHEYFESTVYSQTAKRKVTYYYSDMHVDNLTCTITSTPDLIAR